MGLAGSKERGSPGRLSPLAAAAVVLFEALASVVARGLRYGIAGQEAKMAPPKRDSHPSASAHWGDCVGTWRQLTAVGRTMREEAIFSVLVLQVLLRDSTCTSYRRLRMPSITAVSALDRSHVLK